MRNAFIEELVSLARVYDHIALVVGDLGYSVVEPFEREFPGRFINAGIAEQNMAGLAAGMASEGYHVFTYSIANFPTFRCAEQLRNDVDYHNLPVTTVSVGGGVAYGALGYSHHAIQDYALMRMLPNTFITAPCDPNETRRSLNWLVRDYKGPSYLRLGKAGEPNVNADLSDFRPGIPLLVKGAPDADVVIISTGKGVTKAIECYDNTSRKGTNIAVYTLPVWGYRASQIFASWASSRTKIITFEDHLIEGGFGSWVLEATRQLPVTVDTRGLGSDVVGRVASESTMHHSIDAMGIE